MAGQLDVTRISISRASGLPLADQVCSAIERWIAAGAVDENTRLPTTRELAAALGINRGTVQAAYRRLQERGLVAGRVGSGTVVRGRPEGARRFRVEDLLSRRAAELSDEAPLFTKPAWVADFSRLAPDERFFPLEEFTRTLAYAWSRRRDLWQYAPPLGLEELRGEISRRLAENGVARSAEEILVVSGAQQGLDLLFRTFTDPEDVVAVESPTYSGALTLARLAGVSVLPLPMDAEGPDPRPLLRAAPSSSTSCPSGRTRRASRRAASAARPCSKPRCPRERSSSRTATRSPSPGACRWRPASRTGRSGSERFRRTSSRASGSAGSPPRARSSSGWPA